MTALGYVLASLLGRIGFAAVGVRLASAKHAIPDWMWLLLGTGYRGGFTTFSTYEAIQLFLNREISKAFLYVCSSVLLGCFFAWMGVIFVG